MTTLAPRFDLSTMPDLYALRPGDWVPLAAEFTPNGFTDHYDWIGLVIVVRDGGALVRHRGHRGPPAVFGWSRRELGRPKRGDWVDCLVAWWVGRRYR